MKKITIITSIMLSFAALQEGRAAVDKHGIPQEKSSAPQETDQVSIRVIAGDWGQAQPAEIELLLTGIARQLLERFPGRKVGEVVVAPATAGPVVLYQKGAHQEYQVLLAAKGRNWGEYVYEFSHEFMHILARYDMRAPDREAPHKWFEEMLCESASLYMVRKYAMAWEQTAPRPEWRDYAPRMAQFASRAFGERHRRLPKAVTFEQWFASNEATLEHRPYLREKNELVATLFLPFLEQAKDWRAVEYLNVGADGDDMQFREHMVRWFQMTPAPQRELVRQTFSLFHYPLPGERELRLATGGQQSRGRAGSGEPGL